MQFNTNINRVINVIWDPCSIVLDILVFNSGLVKSVTLKICSPILICLSTFSSIVSFIKYVNATIINLKEHWYLRRYRIYIILKTQLWQTSDNINRCRQYLICWGSLSPAALTDFYQWQTTVKTSPTRLINTVH